MEHEPADIATEDLESALLSNHSVGALDPGGLGTWLRSLEARPGATQAAPACDAWCVYLRWANSVDTVALAPFEFVQQMLSIFDKSDGHWYRGDGRRVKVGRYLMTAAAARKLVAMARDCPPTPEQRELFSFKALQEARHPARKKTI